MDKRRWYDNQTYTPEALELLKNLDYKTRYKISQDIIDVVRSIKTHNSELEQPQVSIGYDRVAGLFAMENNKRWYDRYDGIKQAIRTASTLPLEDFDSIMAGICSSLSSDNE